MVRTMKAVWLGLIGSMLVAGPALGETAYTIAGSKTAMAEVYKEDQAAFYDLEKKKFELIERVAKEKYLDYFWKKRAKETGKSVAAAQKEYEKKNIKVSEKELKETLDKFKDHPSLAKLSKEEQEQQIRDYLTERSRRDIYDGIVTAGIKKGELKINFPEPQEPVYSVPVTDKDHVRYGPEPGDTKPMGCKGDDCAITIVEYSEFQCPFCVRVLPATRQVLTDYKGKVRWIVRDFPLSFHDRARPAAIAAHCAGKQGKYWNMYAELFNNQRALSDADLTKYAENIGVDKKKYQACVSQPGEIEKIIDENFRSGAELGVSGTPAFFVNGRRLSGAQPFSEFKRIIEDELKKKKNG